MAQEPIRERNAMRLRAGLAFVLKEWSLRRGRMKRRVRYTCALEFLISWVLVEYVMRQRGVGDAH